MDSFNELTNQLALLNQQLRKRKMANEYHQRVTNQVRNPHMLMAQVQYGGTPYWNNYNSGWKHCPSLSWNTSHNTLQSPQVQRSSLEETMVELERGQAELAMAHAEFSRSRAEMDYSQVGLHRFLDKNEKIQPSQERMTKLEAKMAKLERVRVECATTQVQFLELTRTNVQIQPTPFKSVKDAMAPMATSCTQLTFEKEQPKQEESMMSIQEC